MIGLLEQFGYEIRPPYSKKVADNLFELRIRGVEEVRAFFTFHKGSAYLLYGFIKKSRKLPKMNLKKALMNKLKLTSYNL